MAGSLDSCVVGVQSLHMQNTDQLAVMLWNLDIRNPIGEGPNQCLYWPFLYVNPSP